MNLMQTCEAESGRAAAEPLVGIVAADRQRHRRLVEALEDAAMACHAITQAVEDLAEVEPAPQVVVLCPGDEGTDLLNELRLAREALPEARLVVIWPPSSLLDERRALRAGADGLVRHDELPGSLGLTIRAVVSGLTCVSGSMRGSLERESLSMREKQVLSMLVMGLSNAEIAAKLFLAESTVKSHLSSAYTKLGVASRKDAASRILDPEEGLGPGILAISAA